MKHLVATIMYTLFDVGEVRLTRGIPDRVARVITDKSTWETDMQGMPISRLARDGWEYTLYGGSGPRPFIHALDTRHATAVCIDMPWKYQPDKVFSYRLRWGGDGRVVVRGPRGRALAVVDAASKQVVEFVRNP